MIQTAERASRPKRSSGDDGAAEALPFVIELWNKAASKPLRVLARAQNAALARAIFKAAAAENPERKIVLRRGARVLASSE